MTVAEYDKCVSQYSDNLYRFALKSLRSDDEAKDIVQESFLRLWENREAVLSGKEKSYLFTVAYRLIVDRVRMGKRYTGDESVLRTSPAPGRPDYNGISELITRVRDNILKSKEQKNIQPTKGGHKMVTCQNYVSLFYRQITSCPSDGGIS